jgi:hypothetical protein
MRRIITQHLSGRVTRLLAAVLAVSSVSGVAASAASADWVMWTNSVHRGSCRSDGTSPAFLVVNLTVFGMANKPIDVTTNVNSGSDTGSPFYSQFTPDSNSWTGDVFVYAQNNESHSIPVGEVPVSFMFTDATDPTQHIGPQNDTVPACDLSGVNHDPTPQDDTLSVTAYDWAPVNVLTNDSDPDGDSLTVQSVGSAHHGLSSLTSGQVYYKPNTGYVGTDSFQYTVSDGHGGTAAATVTITVGTQSSNRAPIAVPDQGTMTHGDPAFVKGLMVDVLTNDSDPDGDSLTVESVTQPAHGMATVELNAVHYTPVVGFAGNDTFSYTINDGHGGTAAATVTITVKAAPSTDPGSNPNPDPTPQPTPNPDPDPKPTPTPQPTPTPTPQSKPVVALTSKGKLKVKKGTVSVKVSCSGASQCKGTLSLKSGKTVLGKTTFVVKKGTSTVKVKLTKKGVKLLKAKHHLKVVAATAGAKSVTLTLNA